MKLAPAQLAGFLRAPPPEIRAALFYGPDVGLVQERATAAARAICPALDDPFRVALLSAAGLAGDPALLADEAAQISLMGGRRVLRVRDAADALAPLFESFIDTTPGDALVVVEAGDLPARGALRRVFEAARRGVAIACYPDTARDLATLVRETLAAHRVTVSRDAIAWLVEHLGADRQLTRAELEKLALYAGDGGTIELDDARIAIADSAALSLDDVVLAAAEGDAKGAERALGRVFAEGQSPVTVVRALLRHLHRLYPLVAAVAGGMAPEAALRAARPPIFFKQQDSFHRQLTRWREGALRRRLAVLAEAELRMKLTGLPAETICREAVLATAISVRPRR